MLCYACYVMLYNTTAVNTILLYLLVDFSILYLVCVNLVVISHLVYIFVGVNHRPLDKTWLMAVTTK